MPEAVRIWEILDGDSLKEIKSARLNLEERVENWLERDISIISNDLLVIGRQIETDFGGVIDLLCLDYSGDVVILELKRDKTPREITAQILDYASWVKDLSNERITEIADRYLGDRGPLEEAFKGRFGVELPEILNEHHEMLIVASEIDSSSERIVKYLSDSYGVGINAVTFQYFRGEDGKEFLARVFLIEPSQVEYSTQTKTASKRKPPLSYEELEEIAERNGIGELYRQLVEGLTSCFDQRVTTRSTIAFIGIMAESRNTIFSLVPRESDSNQGVRFQVYIDRLSDYLGVERDVVIKILPSESEDYEPWKGAWPTLVGFFKNADEINRFLTGLSELKLGR
jgi:hypothetical protein